jgi:hypothetical protein
MSAQDGLNIIKQAAGPEAKAFWGQRVVAEFIND